MASSAKKSLDAELSALREKKLTTQFNRYFSNAASAIAKERTEAELALQEIERRRAEAALKMANNPNIGTRIDISKLDEMYLELKRREESVRKRERETLDKYRNYMHSASNNFQVDLSGSKTVGSSNARNVLYKSPPSVLKPDLGSGDNRENVRKLNIGGAVGKGVLRYSNLKHGNSITTPSPLRSPVGVTPIRSSINEMSIVDESPKVAKTLTYDDTVDKEKHKLSDIASIDSAATEKGDIASIDSVAAEKGDIAPIDLVAAEKGDIAPIDSVAAEKVTSEQKAPMGSSEQTATTAESSQNDYTMKKLSTVSDSDSGDDGSHWTVDYTKGDDDDSISVWSHGNSTIGSAFDESTYTRNTIVFVSDAEMMLTNFLQKNKESIAQLSIDINNGSTSVSSVTGGDAMSPFSTEEKTSKQVKLDYMEAVAGAERAAQQMASAVMQTTNIAPDTGDAAKRKDQEANKQNMWYQYWSEEHEREYYFQPSTNTVSWVAPDEYDDTTNNFHNNSNGTSSEPQTEEEKLQQNMQNWSIDDFLPEGRKKKKKSKGRKKHRREGGKRKKKKKKRTQSLSINEDEDDERTVASRSSRRSASSQRSQRSISSVSHLSRSILAPPTKKYSIWNSRNRKLRKTIIRRSFKTLVISGIIYKAGIKLHEKHFGGVDVKVLDIVPEEAIEKVDSFTTNKQEKTNVGETADLVSSTENEQGSDKAAVIVETVSTTETLCSKDDDSCSQKTIDTAKNTMDIDDLKPSWDESASATNTDTSLERQSWTGDLESTVPQDESTGETDSMALTLSNQLEYGGRAISIHDFDRPGHCLLPFLSWITPNCRLQAKRNPLFDIEALLDIMME